MTASLIPTLVPALALPPRSDHTRSPRTGSRRPLPVAALIAQRDRSPVYGLAAVDSRGRVADHLVVQALGWQRGTPLTTLMTGGLILVTATEDGQLAVSSQGRVHLPAAVRHACRIVPGDRVLLAAEPDEGVLVVHPPATIDAMFTRFRNQAMVGDAA